MNIGRKIYYDKVTGNVLQDCGERQGCVVETIQDQDFQTYPTLQGISQETVGTIRLVYGQFIDNFMKYPYSIDITKTPIDENAIVWDISHPYVIV